MKTKYFSVNILDEDDKEQFLAFQEGDDNLFSEIHKWFDSQESYPEVKGSVIENIIDKASANPEIANKSFVMFYRLIRILNEAENDAMDFIEDLNQCYPELIKEEKKLSDRLIKAQKLAAKFDLFFKTEGAASSGAPLLKSSSIIAAFKPVVKERFDYEKIDIKDYTPEIIKFEPSVLFELDLDNDEKISFQMRTKHFDRFINKLIAIQLELTAAKNEIKK